MRLLLLSTLAALAATTSLHARTFTSADGTKTMEAELISYRPSTDTVVMKFAGRSARSTAKASAFSEEDQAYFKEFLKESSKRDALEIELQEKSESFDQANNIYTYEKSKESYTVSITNEGDFEFEDLNVKYDIYVSRYDDSGKKSVEVVSGEASIAKIQSNLDEQFETTAVDVTVDCSTSSSCPKCKTHAASVKRERVIGLHVRVYDKEGEFLTEHYSSNAVVTAAKKNAE